MAIVAVAQHLVSAVLTGDNDKTTSINVEGIVGIGIVVNRGRLSKGKPQVIHRGSLKRPGSSDSVNFQKIACCLTGNVDVDVGCIDA